MNLIYYLFVREHNYCNNNRLATTVFLSISIEFRFLFLSQKQAFKMILETSKKDQKCNRKRKGEDVVSKAVKKARNDCSCKRLNMLSLMPTGKI